MKIDILTTFPEMFSSLNCSILEKAQENNLLQINLVNIRDFSLDKHKKTDDTPFGGGAGMVMTCQPIYDAIMSVKTENSKLIYMSPKGKTFCQELVKDYSKYEHIIILCGHYEGIDERILELFDFDEISIGDYVLTGGELPAMVFVDAVSRYVDGVISSESTKEESFSNNLLEYPQYTKPQEFMGLKVPDVLVSGNHKEIAKWREQKSIEITKLRRPDLLKK
ncbi:MAG: tRNA (guanosine(37)-N1)-methyltransferase TrmD [Clostridiales bacterium]|nr:tRNA (guanosine(37)-N1)-methyltransferase TrmD [Candidatus Apopatousia equi]